MKNIIIFLFIIVLQILYLTIYMQPVFSEDYENAIIDISIRNEIKYIDNNVTNIYVLELSNNNSEYSQKLIKANHLDPRIISDISLYNKSDISKNKTEFILYIHNVGEFSDEFREYIPEDDIDTFDNEITKYNVQGNIITCTALGKDGADVHVCVFKILEGKPILIHTGSLGNIKFLSK